MAIRAVSWCFVVVAVIASTIGCTLISVLSGPRTLSPGDTASYVLSLKGGHGSSGSSGLWVVAEVPETWSLLSNFYTGTIGGVPVSGSATIVGVPLEFSYWAPAVGDGFQRLCVQIEEGYADATIDSGEMTLEFEVNDVPEGEFVLKFWFLGETDGLYWGPPAYAAINREPHAYRFAGALSRRGGALERNRTVASSNDGRSVVLGGGPEADISVIDRDPSTGALEHNQHLSHPAIDEVNDLAFSPGDEQVYAVDDSHLVCYQRDAITGQLTVSQILQNNVSGVDGLGGARSVVISPDGASVYVAAYDDDAVSFFDRDPSSGEMTVVDVYFNDTGGITGLDGPVALAVSPDGRQRLRRRHSCPRILRLLYCGVRSRPDRRNPDLQPDHLRG